MGSGKTAIAKALAARRPVAVIDGDAAGHKVLKDQSVKQRLRQVFGDSIFDEEGQVNRRALGRLVFGPSPEQAKARKRLHEVVHPEIRKLLCQQIERAREKAGVQAVILDAAVLLEAGWNDLCTAVVFIDAPPHLRADRVAQDRGWSQQEWTDREASQTDLETKRRRADFVIHNTGTIEGAAVQLEQIIDELTPQ